jgi:hypothetical protein
MVLAVLAAILTQWWMGLVLPSLPGDERRIIMYVNVAHWRSTSRQPNRAKNKSHRPESKKAPLHCIQRHHNSSERNAANALQHQENSTLASRTLASRYKDDNGRSSKSTW